MPLLRYFTFVGGALIALLFVASYLFPETPTIPRQDGARPVIRISSDRVGPPRVDIDTAVRTAAAPALAQRELLISPIRQAEAQLLSPAPTPAAPAFTPAAPVKSEAKLEQKNEIKKTKLARRPDRQPIAAYPHMAAYPPVYQPFRWTW